MCAERRGIGNPFVMKIDPFLDDVMVDCSFEVSRSQTQSHPVERTRFFRGLYFGN